MKQPMLPPLAALAGGIAAAQHSSFSFPETLISCSLLAALALTALRREGLRLAAGACLAAFLVLGVWIGSAPHTPDPRRLDQVLAREKADLTIPARIAGWVREPPEAFEDADLFVLEAETIYRGSEVSGGVRVTVNRREGEPPLKLEYGQRVELLARLREVRNFENPGAFDRIEYLGRRGIFLSAGVRPLTPIYPLDGRGGTRIEAWLWRCRGWARARLERLLDEARVGEEAGAILRAMLLGDRRALSPETESDFQRSGAYHVLVISGLHVGIMAFALAWALRRARTPRWLAAALMGGAALGYAVLVGANPPAMRAAVMLTAYLITRLIFRQRRALNVIALTATCFLLADPEILFDGGFQLSFGAVMLIAGIAVPLLDSTIAPYQNASTDLWDVDRDLHIDPRVAQFRVAFRMWLEPLAVVLRTPREVVTAVARGVHSSLIWLVSLALLSLVVQVGMALPMAAYFHRISLNGVWVNVAITPVVMATVVAGLAGLLSGLAPLVSLAGWAAEKMAAIAAGELGMLPLDFRVPPPPAWLALAFAAALVGVGWSISRSRRGLMASLALTAAGLGVMIWHPFEVKFEPGRLDLTLIDVGQGESLALWLPDGGLILVDAGGLPEFGLDEDEKEKPPRFDVGDEVVSPYLWSRSVKRIEALALTHADTDHIGGAAAVLKNFQIKELWLPAVESGDEFKAVRELAAEQGTKVRRLNESDRMNFGEVEIEVLSSGGEGGDASNDRSLVLAAQFREARVLLTGDISRKIEQSLLGRIACPPDGLLKVAHHGSRFSSDAAWLDCVRPIFAVVSAGADNFYGHPHTETLGRLRAVRSEVLSTAADGFVSVSTDGLRWRVDSWRRQQMARIVGHARRHGETIAEAMTHF